tara:strand:- start:79 stop:363 length:285 start_codon:yes stop_codon:yes gene_type:complete
MANLPPQPTTKDVEVYNNVRNQLINENITGKDVYNMMKQGKFTPGTLTLLHDIVDFGHYRADEETKAEQQYLTTLSQKDRRQFLDNYRQSLKRS